MQNDTLTRVTNRTVVTLIGAGDGSVNVLADNRSERFRSVDQAIERAREILNTDPAERHGYNQAFPKPNEDEQAQAGPEARQG